MKMQCWQDVEGTVPCVTDGDPVGRTECRTDEGRMIHTMTCKDDAKKPEYRTEGEQ